MAYQLLKELSPDCITVQNETGEKFIFDRIPFAIAPKENLRKEIQKEIREIVEEEKTIKVAGLIKYIDLEKFQNEFYLIRENSRSFHMQKLETETVEGSCQALLLVLKVIQAYHQSQIVLGGISPGTLKKNGKNYCLLDPLVFNYLNKSLEEEYRIERAPEVISGNNWSPESDVFSWGVLAYRLLSGVDPFQAATQEERVAKILRMNVTPLKDVKPGVSFALDRLVMSCLSKDPQKRPKVEYLIQQLIKMLEDKSYVLSETEAQKYQEQAKKHRAWFRLKEAVWLWTRKYGKVSLFILGILFFFIWMIWGFRAKPTITAAAKPADVLGYYFQGIKDINVSLVDEAVHKAKNSFADTIATVHVVNTTNKAAVESNENLLKINFEDLKYEKLLETPKEAKYRAHYTMKIIMPRSTEFIERTDIYTLKPVRKIWRITDIKVLKRKQWKVETKPSSPNQ